MKTHTHTLVGLQVEFDGKNSTFNRINDIEGFIRFLLILAGFKLIEAYKIGDILQQSLGGGTKTRQANV